MGSPKIEQYDLDKLHEAKRILVEVMEYYYGTPGYDSIVNRLGTIVRKIQFIESSNHPRPSGGTNKEWRKQTWFMSQNAL